MVCAAWAHGQSVIMYSRRLSDCTMDKAASTFSFCSCILHRCCELQLHSARPKFVRIIGCRGSRSYCPPYLLRSILKNHESAEIPCRWIPPANRGKAISTIYAASSAGTVVGLMSTPVLAQILGGWPACFLLFAALGIAWAVSTPCCCTASPLSPLFEREREFTMLWPANKSDHTE